MKNLWRKFRNWIKTPEGVCVEVVLDAGFARIQGAKRSALIPFAHTLRIMDLSVKDAEKLLAGMAFDWHSIPFAWRHDLEIGGLHKAKWGEVKSWLRTEK